MKKITILAILIVLTLILFVAARPGVAAVWETGLAVQAAVEPWNDHVVTFDAGETLPRISSVRLLLEGEGGGQFYVGCSNPWVYGTEEGKLQVVLRAGDPPVFLAERTLDFGTGPRLPFEIEIAFDGVDFSGLEGGAGTLELIDPARMFLSGTNWICPVGNGCLITAAALTVTYGDMVAVEEFTWGALKALYR